MKLVYDWKHILKRAWSLRLIVLAFAFEGAELVLPLFVDLLPRGWFAGLSLVALAGSVAARFIQQKNFYR